MPDAVNSPSRAARSAPTARKVGILVVVAAVFALALFKFGERLSLDALAEQESSFRAYQQNHPVLVYAAAFLLYVAVTGLSLPGATAMTLLLGWLLGFGPALIVVSFASTTGATLAFSLSRYLLRDSLQDRFSVRLQTVNSAFEREGAFYLFSARLIPVLPFFVINLVMGLTPIRTSTFWWVSQLGMFPATAVYTYAGSSVPNLQHLAENGVRGIVTPQLLIAFILLGLLPLTVKKLLAVLRPASDPNPKSAIPDDSHPKP